MQEDTKNATTAEIRSACAVLFEPGQVSELRAFGVPTGNGYTANFSGYFNDFDCLASEAARLDSTGAEAVYVVLNPVNPVLMARANNRTIKAKRGEATANEHVTARRWLFLDFDAKRPAGISSTNVEHAAALDRASACREHLASLGWPDPVEADSGNGSHLLYRVDLPADDGGLVKLCVQSLATMFSDKEVEVDTAVHNSARLCKLYGTVARKGDATEDRPHRRSRLLTLPDTIEPVPERLLRALAAKVPTNGQSTKSHHPNDPARVRSALLSIPPRPAYEEWIRIIAAVRDAVGSDAEALLSEWSPEEKTGEYAEKLASPLDRVTAGTLFHIAKGHGWSYSTNGTAPALSADARDEPEDGDESKPRQTLAARLLNLVEGMGAELFHDDEGRAYITINEANARQTHRLTDRTPREWLARLLWKAEGRSAPAKSIDEALNTLAGRARFEGDELRVAVRVAELDTEAGIVCYIDLGDDSWRVLEIRPGGWRIIASTDCPIRFIRRSGSLPLPEPVSSGPEVFAVFAELLGLESTGPSFRLLLFWLLQAFRGRGPYPVLEVTGEQGSGKSTVVQFIRSLIDPNTAPLRTLPHNDREGAIQCANAWIQAWDNLSGLRQDTSDRICRIATGGALACRTLYTDDEEQLFSFCRPVIMNGISGVAEKADLAERCIALRLPRIMPENRKTEQVLNAEFESMRPALIGALLAAVAVGLERLPHTELAVLPRMADFAQFSTACEQALGMEQGVFLAAYDQSSKELIEATIEADPVATTVLDFVKSKGDFEGTASELNDALTDFAGYEKDGDKQKPKEWPGNALALSNRLTALAPSLRVMGVAVERSREPGKNRRRLIHLGESSENLASVASVPSDRGDNRPTRHANATSSADATDRTADATDRTRNLFPSDKSALDDSVGADSDASDATDAKSGKHSPPLVNDGPAPWADTDPFA